MKDGIQFIKEFRAFNEDGLDELHDELKVVDVWNVRISERFNGEMYSYRFRQGVLRMKYKIEWFPSLKKK